MAWKAAEEKVSHYMRKPKPSIKSEIERSYKHEWKKFWESVTQGRTLFKFSAGPNYLKD